ncbi:MAG: tRNA 2-thiouridine(34) synthase MnmA [Deltaproteobacteria bacterium]|nr:tRNA 2-thiouridine(34) synthase MnmA [Deltaproteobacteria bacterium]
MSKVTRGKVLVAMSGGVDSAVAALLLCEQGFEVVGITMCLGIKEESGGRAIRCCDSDALTAAQRVCDKLVIPHHIFDYTQEFTDMVVIPFAQAYARGRTPNPCVECNRLLKFDSLLKKALALEYDFLATGHYAGVEERNERLFIKKARDRRKDQSYFLYAIAPSALRSIIFPLAELTKEEVRARARAAGLPVAERGESQDICFVQNGYADFITARLGNAPAGDILDTSGKKLGEHRGIIHYTLGQRSGLGISSAQPLYVIKIDPEHNTLVVGEKRQTLAQKLVATRLNLFGDELPDMLKAKIRYGSAEEDCTARLVEERLVVHFAHPQSAITPGQSIVIYDGELVVGGGIIAEVLDGHG